MNVLMLADPHSAHTIKWVKYLSKKNVNIFLFGLNSFNNEDYSGIQNLEIKSWIMNNEIFRKNDGDLSKFSYIRVLPSIKKVIKKFKPDIIHAHYASSYGLLGALCGFHPFLISVYGSDVFKFPVKNIFTRRILKYNLSKADKIFSTSKIMGEEIKKYTAKQIKVIPFGIDLENFRPFNSPEKLFDNEDIVIGTVKSLESMYGIQVLIKAFKTVRDKYPDFPLKLLLVGGGSEESVFKKMINDLNLTNVTKFTGYISPSKVNDCHNMLDISVFVSLEESFGVSVLEASACEKPVIVSNVGGLPEIVEHNVTGIIVEKENVEQTALALERLILDKKLRITLGQNGRRRVQKYFNIDDNVDMMLKIYDDVLRK